LRLLPQLLSPSKSRPNQISQSSILQLEFSTIAIWRTLADL
jgi:hypothetical protein